MQRPGEQSRDDHEGLGEFKLHTDKREDLRRTFGPRDCGFPEWEGLLESGY